MSLIDRELRDVRDALRANNRDREDALLEVRIRRLRSIDELRVSFEYPVSVLAGPNASGKSTVLFACACAYQVPGARGFAPGRLFPNFSSRQQNTMADTAQRSELEFHYLDQGERRSMAWRRSRAWSRRFAGGSGAGQPARDVYLRTLANLTNPSEVRSILRLGRKPIRTDTVSPELLVFAHRILPWRYRNLAVISGPPTKDLLFAELDDAAGTGYSEFHMSSGERSILRISKDISQLENALVLIDEVDTGLHPYTQQQTMLELQRAALRQNLQVIVASHSPVVLDSVPPDARIFLDRDQVTGHVHAVPLYRDIFQKALYGQSRDRLSILCEDAVAEGVIRGVLDVLNVKLGFRHEDVVIGRNTGRNEFAGHVRALGKFGKLGDFLLVLDGDSRDLEPTLQATAREYGHYVRPLFLPGSAPPEQWLWDAIRRRPDDYAARLGLSADDLERTMSGLERLAAGAVRDRDAAKAAMGTFADQLDRTVPDLARIVGNREAEANAMPELIAALTEQINAWRHL